MTMKKQQASILVHKGRARYIINPFEKKVLFFKFKKHFLCIKTNDNKVYKLID